MSFPGAPGGVPADPGPSGRPRYLAGDTKHLISPSCQSEYLTEEDYEELKAFWEKGGR